MAYEVIAGMWAEMLMSFSGRVQASQFVAEHDDEVCPAKWKPVLRR